MLRLGLVRPINTGEFVTSCTWGAGNGFGNVNTPSVSMRRWKSGSMVTLTRASTAAAGAFSAGAATGAPDVTAGSGAGSDPVMKS